MRVIYYTRQFFNVIKKKRIRNYFIGTTNDIRKKEKNYITIFVNFDYIILAVLNINVIFVQLKGGVCVAKKYYNKSFLLVLYYNILKNTTKKFFNMKSKYKQI